MDDNFPVSVSAFLEILAGVATATQVSDSHRATVESWAFNRSKDLNKPGQVVSSDGAEQSFTLADWKASIPSAFSPDAEDSKQVANLTLAISYMREKCRRDSPVQSAALEIVWQLIHGALTSSRLTQPLCRVNNSAKGRFLIIPLCGLDKDGWLDQVFRLNIWLPGQPRPFDEFDVHSHQAFAQSWILTGVGVDTPCRIERTHDTSIATHAEYTSTWSKGLGYTPYTKRSKIWNTGDLVKAIKEPSTPHSRDMTYNIPAGAYHISRVEPNVLHATLFFFDAHRGFVKDARILGPIKGDDFTHTREPASSNGFVHVEKFTPAIIAQLIQESRARESEKAA